MGKKRPRQNSLGESDVKNKASNKDNDTDNNSEFAPVLKPMRDSDEPPAKKPNWVNKTRVLIFSSRGVTFRARHLVADLKNMMPHSKGDSKMDRKDKMEVINEICEMKNCNKVAFFEMKKKQDLYLWLANVSKGPSAKFLVENVHTMSELKMTGNCLKASRPLLSFDKTFDAHPHYSVMKELLIQIFGTPRNHPKSQPFIDHIFAFKIADNRIWFRNFQIVEEDASMVEIGPRFVLNPIKVFSGSFSGAVLWSNPHFVTPNFRRRLKRLAGSAKYVNRIGQKASQDERKPVDAYRMDATDAIFDAKPVEASAE